MRFLLAARRRECEELQSLVGTCGLVMLISQLVHDLQKERGYSNIFLSHPAKLGVNLLDEYRTNAEHSERALRRCLDVWEYAQGSARLLLHLAHAQRALETLPQLRRRVRERDITSQDATESFTRLIAILLAVIFEAGDAALDPAITSALVAMFNFMQGKELTGQERALGVTAFAAGFFDETQRDLIKGLHERQERSFGLFVAHVDPASLRQWQELQSSEITARFHQLRTLGQRTCRQAPVTADLCDLWFDVCTEYIDGLQVLENHLTEVLLQRCHESIERASGDLKNRRVLSHKLAAQSDCRDPVFFRVQADTLDALSPEGVGPLMNRSLLDSMQSQAMRLLALNEELKQTRAELEERRRLGHAKRLLMKRLRLGEQAAHEHLQRCAMQSGKRLSVVVEEVLCELSPECRKERG